MNETVSTTRIIMPHEVRPTLSAASGQAHYSRSCRFSCSCFPFYAFECTHFLYCTFAFLASENGLGMKQVHRLNSLFDSILFYVKAESVCESRYAASLRCLGYNCLLVRFLGLAVAALYVIPRVAYKVKRHAALVLFGGISVNTRASHGVQSVARAGFDSPSESSPRSVLIFFHFSILKPNIVRIPFFFESSTGLSLLENNVWRHNLRSAHSCVTVYTEFFLF